MTHNRLLNLLQDVALSCIPAAATYLPFLVIHTYLQELSALVLHLTPLIVGIMTLLIILSIKRHFPHLEKSYTIRNLPRGLRLMAIPYAIWNVVTFVPLLITRIVFQESDSTGLHITLIFMAAVNLLIVVVTLPNITRGDPPKSDFECLVTS